MAPHSQPIVHHADVCAGGSGLGLALKIVFGDEVRTVLQLEREAYAVSTLVARMEDQTLDHAPVWDLVETFNGKPWRGRVDILSAGFPCQPFSLAGKRQGTRDKRWIWNDIVRIIREFRCPLVFLENVPGLTLTDQTLTELGNAIRPNSGTPLSGVASSKNTRRLNPLFNEWLMNWPLGWTECDSPVEGLSLWLQQSRFTFWQVVSD